jgi:hypothetical protein
MERIAWDDYARQSGCSGRREFAAGACLKADRTPELRRQRKRLFWSDPRMIGQLVLGKYRVTRHLDEGGMSKIYLAR